MNGSLAGRTTYLDHDPTTRVAERPPQSVFAIAIALAIWLIVPWFLILGTTAQGGYVFGVCLVFSTIAFGICAIAVALSRRRRSRTGVGAAMDGDRLAPRQLATLTGRLPMGAAALQILLIPGSVALGFMLLALVDVLVR